MNEQTLKGLLGLALRARQATAGMDAARILLRSGQCGALLMDGAAGPHTRKKAEDMCRQQNVPAAVLPEGIIRSATGLDNMVLAIRKGSFAEQIIVLTGENA